MLKLRLVPGGLAFTSSDTFYKSLLSTDSGRTGNMLYVSRATVEGVVYFKKLLSLPYIFERSTPIATEVLTGDLVIKKD